VRFLEHTADTAIEVRARSLEMCFARAAAGMFAVFVTAARIGATTESVEADVTAPDPGELLVAWLEELLYLSEVKGLALQIFTVTRVSRHRVTGSAQGAKFGPDDIAQGPAVKGISRHGLQLRRSGSTWQVRLIFDV
jgi:SHS2 domain-containing protein